MGGQISVKHSGRDWQLEARGEKLKVDRDLWSLIDDPTAATEVVAAVVHFALVKDAARAASRHVASFLSETSVTVSF